MHGSATPSASPSTDTTKARRLLGSSAGSVARALVVLAPPRGANGGVMQRAIRATLDFLRSAAGSPREPVRVITDGHGPPITFDVPPGWEHQLVYQFPYVEGDTEQLGYLIALEDELYEATADLSVAAVYGHDAGSGEMNVFLLTREPREAHALLKPIVDGSRRRANRRLPRRLSRSRRGRVPTAVAGRGPTVHGDLAGPPHR